MKILFHNSKRILKVISEENEVIPFSKKGSISSGMMELAVQYPTSKIVWCHTDFEDYLNLTEVQQFMHHDRMMFTYNPQNKGFLGTKIGYVEDSPFININKNVVYPTWQMSSVVGIVHASLLRVVKNQIKLDSDFDYYLNSLAKIANALGLLCYSQPKLLNSNKIEERFNTSKFILFRFVKQHYRMRWVFLLFINMVIYERKAPIFPLLSSLFFRNRNIDKINLKAIEVNSVSKVIDSGTIDVIIPTIGRKKFLYDFLKDLEKQTYLPSNVIIVEQNPIENSISELDYLISEKWPFKIKHIFTHQAGACNARNIALNETEKEWIFMADDDIRIKDSFLEEAFNQINKFGVNAITFGCYNYGYNSNKKYKNEMQWESFGSGCSIVKREVVQRIYYRKGFEFGYGEDSDFGMQLRNKGIDILYSPEPEILHLKAPVGGFRTKPFLEWQNDVIQPKPSPTAMLYKIMHVSQEEINGYRTILFFKFYKLQSIKNPILYFLNFRKQWKQSLYWANQLKNKV
ncbi:glycosyl transferase [Flavobacterium collinsii]|uniref:glycosyltransferase family 2 protein n=1 Tax=Flavobacterium collinsii TaxID=1114861 RepID=UPI0022C7D064|nr:glycosyltransferase family A protein [Flavobacterium collinsii]GIQ58549.1 glycosyl transferase [Flavobacterium collinsii]